LAWSAVGHLNAVADTPALRAAYNAALPKVTEQASRQAADERLYAKIKAVSRHGANLTAPRRQALGNAMRDFVLAGAELKGAEKARFQQIQEDMAELGQPFSRRLEHLSTPRALGDQLHHLGVPGGEPLLQLTHRVLLR
jgi:oligopeptidase A